MIKKRYNLTQEEYQQRQTEKNALISKKERVLLEHPWQGYCDNKDHPLFSIKVTVDKPWTACYYCSKIWMLKNA